MELILSSLNRHKIEEIKDILKDSEITLKPLMPNLMFEVAETADSFVGNATLKALAYAKKYQLPAIADDSGLCVETLNGAPGIYSARYSGLGDEGNRQKLLKVMEHLPNRKAYFVCAIVIAFPDGKCFNYAAKWHGSIAKTASGSNGFGYDPIFIPDGLNQSVGTLDKTYKKLNSHRALALKKMREDQHEIVNYWRHTWQK